MLLSMQDQYQRVDPSFQIKYYIKENDKLVQMHKDRYQKPSIDTKCVQEIKNLSKLLKTPISLKSYWPQQNFITPTEAIRPCSQPVQEILRNKSPDQVSQKPYFSGLKKVLLRHKDVLNKSPKIKSLIDSFNFRIPSQKELTQRKGRVSSVQTTYVSPRGNYSLDTQQMINKNGKNINQIMDLCNDIEIDKDQYKRLKKFNNRMFNKTFNKWK
ncbi:hypothetical protein pb186bvf_015146 [Paramecium bursaria]